MAVQKIGGVTTTSGGSYDELKIDGVITINGDIQAQSIDMDGVVTVNGKLESRDWIRIDGVVTVNDAMRAKDVNVQGVVTIKGNVEGDHVKVDGVVSCKAQISADLVEGRGLLSAEEIVGEKVIVHCEIKRRHLFHMIPWEKKRPHVGTIEATEIDVDGIQCQNLNGHNIKIGPQCVIENVDCSGMLSIAPGAFVRNINGQPRENCSEYR